MTPVVSVAKFAAGVADTSSKMIHEKNPKQKSRDTVPLSGCVLCVTAFVRVTSVDLSSLIMTYSLYIIVKLLGAASPGNRKYKEDVFFLLEIACPLPVIAISKIFVFHLADSHGFYIFSGSAVFRFNRQHFFR